MRNFAGIDDRFCKEDFAKVFLQSVPYDGTSTWGKELIKDSINF